MALLVVSLTAMGGSSRRECLAEGVTEGGAVAKQIVQDGRSADCAIHPAGGGQYLGLDGRPGGGAGVGDDNQAGGLIARRALLYPSEQSQQRLISHLRRAGQSRERSGGDFFEPDDIRSRQGIAQDWLIQRSSWFK